VKLEQSRRCSGFDDISMTNETRYRPGYAGLWPAHPCTLSSPPHAVGASMPLARTSVYPLGLNHGYTRIGRIATDVLFFIAVLTKIGLVGQG